MELHKATAGDGLMLVYSKPPRNLLRAVGGVVLGAVIAYFGFLRIFPDGGPLLALLGIVLAGGAIALVYMPHTVGVVTDFDKVARQVKVTTTRSDGREESLSAGFDDIRTIQLFQQRSKGTQTQTLTLMLSDGRKVFLGDERQQSGWFQPPFNDGLAAMIKRIREETGVGGIEELPMPMQALGSIIGVDRK